MPKLSGKNVLVTGGAGFIGSHLVDRLILENPSKLTVVDNFFLGTEANLVDARKAFSEVSIYRLDASNLSAMQQLVQSEKVDIVFNLAVVPLPTSLEYPAWTVETNVSLGTTFCELARRECFETLVHCSSSEAYGSAQYVPMDEAHPLIASTPYAASKVAADQVVLSYRHTFNIDAVIVRPFNNIGPRQNSVTYAGIIPITIQRVKNGQPIEIFGNGEQTRDFMFVRDTAEAFVGIYNQKSTRGKVINIATEHETSVNELVAMLLRIMETPDHPVVHTDARPGDVLRHCGGIKLAQKLIGFEPVPISDEHLEETVDWYLRR